MAFGPSCHRVWVVGMRPLGCSLGSCGEASRRPFGGTWGPRGGLLKPLLWPLGGLSCPDKTGHKKDPLTTKSRNKIDTI
eukprot:6170786-Pyramimonas_sp.AAC.1